MSTLETLVREAEDAPEPLLEEVLDFLLFLKSRRAEEQPAGDDRLLLDLSKTSFARDWESPEEEEAWTSLSSGPTPTMSCPTAARRGTN